jgi:hypothetical protein
MMRTQSAFPDPMQPLRLSFPDLNDPIVSNTDERSCRKWRKLRNSELDDCTLQIICH